MVKQNLIIETINHTDKPQVGQHNTSMNEELYKLLVSGVSLRRASELLDVAYNTVLARFDYLAEQCKVKHLEHLKTIQTKPL
jgi:ribulose 1,5-bisphosphate carboxylase large subunit-like protein